MSARYSTSPSLCLEIGNSRILRLLHALACLLAALSLYRLSLRGYPLAALALSPVAGLCCWRLAGQKLAGARICWRQGEWTLQQGPSSTPLAIHPGSTCLPWVIYLAWTEPTGRGRGSLFLFPDSAPADALRQLRVRLTLER